MSTLRLGDMLLEKGLILEKQIRIAVNHQKITGLLLGDTLVKLGFLSSSELGETLAEHAKVRYVDLANFSINEDALRMIPKATAEKFHFIPLDIEDGVLTIGILNPNNIMAIDAVTKIIGKQPAVCIVDAEGFQDATERAYFFLENPIQRQIDQIINSLLGGGVPDGNAVTTMTDLVIMDAIRRKVTDIHITPTVDVVQIFYRIDGVLQHGHGLPQSLHNGLVSRIKILSHLDIAEQRLPQDGSFSFTLLKRSYDIRVSTVPTIYGENVVLRILGGSGTILRIERLGFDPHQTRKIRTLFQKPHGIILITGPTGSGKTTTLYAALREIDLMEKNVLTVEDPVEYKLSLAKQTQVTEKVGYDFAMAGRNFMRQDPDVMLLGEIRDEETARIAIRAAITGHLVLSTLHTNDAITVIPRLMDLKVDRFLMSSSLLAILAQRLIRKVCSFCTHEYQLNDDELAIFAEYSFKTKSGMKGAGCDKCNGTGYLGRTVIGEILIINDEIRELIFAGASPIAMQEAAVRSGMKPLHHEALAKAAAGVTTLEEVMRVTG